MKMVFTRALSDVDRQRARERGIDCVEFPLIGVDYAGLEAILSRYPDIWSQLESAKAVVFTSGNGVTGLLGDDSTTLSDSGQKLLSVLRKKPVYTVGESTADVIEPFGILARFPDDYNAVSLAKMMLLDGVHTQIIHFCGDIRRPELGQAMKEAGISVLEVETYSKQGLLQDNEQVLDQIRMELGTAAGVVFYSPSAVGEFFSRELDRGFRGSWYAIGQTTARALEERGVDVLVPRAPMTEVLLDFMAKHV
jgi:uroporphyrinogen-III synthase